MARTLTIAVDVDEVCAALIPEWLRRYNRDHGDNLTADEATVWELDEVVKCGKEIFKYLHDPDLYDHVQPIPGARPAIYEMLARGHRVIYVTACPRGTIEQKRSWLLRWGFLTEKNAERDFVPCSDKSLIKADYLFDDRLKNVVGFSGYGVLVDQPHNQKDRWFYSIDRLASAPWFLKNHSKHY